MFMTCKRATLVVMGASNSRLEEDKGLQLCRERKKFIKQALNGRCSLAAAHVAYIEELKTIGASLSRFVELYTRTESFVHSSRKNVTLEPSDLFEISVPHLSFSSRSLGQHVDAATLNVSSQDEKVEEKPVTPITVSVNSNTPHSTQVPEASAYETPPWDYFGLFHPTDEIGHQKKEEEGVHELDDLEEKLSTPQDSESEFDEPSLATLIRSFRNIHYTISENIPNISPGNRELETNFSPIENKNEANESVDVSEPELVNEKKNKSPNLSPLRATSSRFMHMKDVKITPMKESEVEEKVAPKDFFSSIKHIEKLFVKASESGREVPRMLEAHKFHFRPVFPGKDGGSLALSLLKSCFSCGEDPSEVQQEPPQDSVKYLTWHRTTSSRSASSRNLLGANTVNDVGNLSNNHFDDFCMVSGSHASTLDRLYAWEKKLYDEVKAGQVLRIHFDMKRKLLQQRDSRGENTDKTRAVLRDLHSRIKVAIHRIDSVSKKIEEIRDNELQPQLEELIEGLRKMWETMLDCHKLQLHIISISQAPGSKKLNVKSDSQRQMDSTSHNIHLKNELNSFITAFAKWIDAQKTYLEAIDMWLFKCVSLPKNKSKRNKRMKPPPIRNIGPPIYMICSARLEMIDNLPSRRVIDSIQDLAAEVPNFFHHQDNHLGKSGDLNTDNLREEGEGTTEDWVLVLDRFRTNLAGFLGQLSNFAEASVEKFTELQRAIEVSKRNYEEFKSQQ